MPFARASRGRTRSLRFRLMVWNAVVVLVTAIVTLVGLREGVRITLLRELDQVLSEDLREIELALKDTSPVDWQLLAEQLDRKDAGHAQHQWFARLIDDTGQVSYHSSHAPLDLPKEKVAGGGFQTRGQWRFISQSVAIQPRTTVQVGSSLKIVRADVARIDRLVGLAVLLVLLIAPLCGYWLAGRATQPLNAMMNTLVQLRPSQLDDRLAIRGTGDELDRLSSVVNRLLDRIGSYLEERRDFLANAAHELRTPLAAIRSSIEVALASRRTSAEYEELLAEVIAESGSLEVLVNQLLLLSETDAERLRVHTETVELAAIVERALDMFGGVAEFRNIELRAQRVAPASVHGNPQHLRQVVYNLLDNALKFTASGGWIEVQLAVQAGQVVFSVRDSGVGIAQADLPRLFDRFFRVDRSQSLDQPLDKETRGTGLGLSICQAIVHAHHGTINVESEIGQGSCFTVKILQARAADAL